jgi:hypothetical protein
MPVAIFIAAITLKYSNSLPIAVWLTVDLKYISSNLGMRVSSVSKIDH